jgi:DNA-binding NarL/FixJ family response regulator
MNRPTLRVLVADDHEVVRKGIRTMLEDREGWHVCAEATTGTEAVKLTAQLRPDIVIMDVEMKELDGLEATRRIKKGYPEIEVLIFTMHDAEYLIREALSAGARAFVLKSEGGRNLISAVENIAEHRSFIAGVASEVLLKNMLRVPVSSEDAPRLTAREREIVQLLADGKSNKETATIMGISVKTVETHRASVMRKLGLNSIVELVRYAVREGFIKA